MELRPSTKNRRNYLISFQYFLQTTSTVVEVVRCRSPFRSPPSRLIHGRWRRWDVEQSPLTVVDTGLSVGVDHLAVESPTDLFVASHWLERSSRRFPLTNLLVFSRADHSTSQVLSPFMWFLSQLFTEGLLQKPPSSSDWSTAVTSHVAVYNDARSIQISSQIIRIRC